LIGKKGAGKSFLGRRKIEKLIGESLYLSTARRDDLCGKWSDHLEGKIFIQLEEAIWAGNHQEMSELNAEITEDKTTVRTRFQSMTPKSRLTRPI
jgi:hypothetical protein